MKTISTDIIAQTVCNLCMNANFNLNSDIVCALARAEESEQSQTGRKILGQILENSEIAREEHIAMCQDTGMAVVFVKVSQNVRIEGGAFKDAINEGVQRQTQNYCRA